MLSNHLILCRPLLLLSSASGSCPLGRLLTSSGQSIGAPASASGLPMNIQGWFPLGLTGLISLHGSQPCHGEGAYIAQWNWAMLCKATQVGWIIVKSSDKMWSIGEGMVNHPSILALRIPWTVWKGKKIWHQKISPPPIARPEAVQYATGKEQRAIMNSFRKSSLLAQWQRICLPMKELQVQSLGWEDPPEKEMATHSRILAWETP